MLVAGGSISVGVAAAFDLFPNYIRGSTTDIVFAAVTAALFWLLVVRLFSPFEHEDSVDLARLDRSLSLWTTPTLTPDELKHDSSLIDHGPFLGWVTVTILAYITFATTVVQVLIWNESQGRSADIDASLLRPTEFSTYGVFAVLSPVRFRVQRLMHLPSMKLSMADAALPEPATGAPR